MCDCSHRNVSMATVVTRVSHTTWCSAKVLCSMKSHAHIVLALPGSVFGFGLQPVAHRVYTAQI